MPRAAKSHLAPTVRAAFLRALDLIEDQQGLTFSQLMAKAIEEHGVLEVLSKIGKYVERESNVSVQVEHSLVDVLSSLDQRAGHDTSVESEPGSVRH